MAAEIAGETQAAPIAAAVGEVVELVDVVAAAVEQHADAAVGRLSNARPHALAEALVAGRFRLVGIGIQAAAIVVVAADEVFEQAEAQRAAQPWAHIAAW